MSHLSPCRPPRAPYAREPVDEEVEAYIRELRQEPKRRGWCLQWEEYRIDRLRTYGLEPGSHYTEALPLLEIISITIHPTIERRCQIYGVISLIDEKGNEFHVYNRSKNNSELVKTGCELSLMDIPISPVRPYRVSVSLWDEVQCSRIAEGGFDLHFTDESDFDGKLKVKKVHGDCGHASVSYRTFHAAHVAEIHVSVQNNNYDNLSIYGVIRTGFEEGKSSVVTLFKKEKNEAVSVRPGEFIKLSRSMVAMRACSSLKVGVILFDSESNCIEVRGLVNFGNWRAKFSNGLQIRGEKNDWVVTIHEDWSYNEKLLSEMKETTQVSSPTLSSIGHRFEFGLVEIFSISIGCEGCSTTSKIVGVRGTTRVQDSNGGFYIFDGDRDGNQDRLICWPSRCVKVSGFRMRLNLSDSEGNKLCKGYLLLSYSDVGKRMCSVISGDNGCASIHYTVFTNSLQGKVIIELLSATSNLMDIFGRIVARYKTHEYRSYYDKKYYQSVLFESSYESSTAHSSGLYLPLVKRAIVGPKDTSVVISVDLKAFPSPISKTDTKQQSLAFVLKDELKFKPGRNDTQIICGNGFDIGVTVKWQKV